MPVDVERIDSALGRRQGGYGRSARQRIERDSATISSGVRHGLTLGSPVTVTIANRDHENWLQAMSVPEPDEQQPGWRGRPVTVPRPGHADMAGVARGGFADVRNVLERASARETAARVATGALAAQLLRQCGIEVRAHVRAIAGVATDIDVPERDEWAARETSQLACLDPGAEELMCEAIDAARAERDTVGGLIEVVAYGVPPGIGSYTNSSDRLGARLAAAAMSVQAIKAVEIGDGFALAGRRGSNAHDELYPVHEAVDRVAQNGVGSVGLGMARRTNRAGGIEGGMSNGSPIVLRCAMKPLPTLMRPLGSVDIESGESTSAHAERSDVCSVPAASVVVEAAVAFELARVLREHFGTQALTDMLGSFTSYCDRVRYRTGAAVPAPA